MTSQTSFFFAENLKKIILFPTPREILEQGELYYHQILVEKASAYVHLPGRFKIFPTTF